MPERTVHIPPAGLEGDLSLPDGAKGIVLFAHGSGSSRFSSRNRYVAGELNRVGLGTLLLDLLTYEEGRVDDRTGRLRFDIRLLAGRLLDALLWLRQDSATAALRVGLFGASTGGAAALVAAAEAPDRVFAVVSRGGRPDLAGRALAQVSAPTLLIVGALDEPVVSLNHEAFRQLSCTKRLDLVPGATHLFEEPGGLEAVASLASEWFLRFLEPPSRRDSAASRSYG